MIEKKEISFYHTMGSPRILLILVHLFYLKLKRKLVIFFILFRQSLIRTKKSSFIQINHLD